MKSLLLVLLLLAPSSSTFGQEENALPPTESRSPQAFSQWLQSIDTNHNALIDADEVGALGDRANGFEGVIRGLGLELKYPINMASILNAYGRKYAHRTLKEILEDMPRKPEKGDNNLASKVANEWLNRNAIGFVIQFTGKLSHIGQTSSQKGNLVVLSFEGKRGLWEGFDFDLSIQATTPPNVNVNDYSKISQGDLVTLEGKISNLKMEWGSGKGNINLSLADCKLISVNKPEPTEKITKTGSGTLVISGSNTYTGDTEASKSVQEPTPAKTKVNTGWTTVTAGTLVIPKPSKFWTGTADSGECAVRLDEIHFVSLIEAKTNDPPMWHILVLLKTKNEPIPLSFKDAEKAHAVYQNLLQALESGSEKVVEGIGKNPEAGLRGTVRMQNAPAEKPKPPEEKKEKGLFD